MRLLHFQYISTPSYAMLIVRTSLQLHKDWKKLFTACSAHMPERGQKQVILINKPLTLQELEQIMQDNWDKEQYGSFKIGRPTPASIEEYILLPATRRYLTIVYPRAAGGFFSKENKVILSTADSPEGAQIAIAEYLPVKGPLLNILQTKSVLSAEKERKGPART